MLFTIYVLFVVFISLFMSFVCYFLKLVFFDCVFSFVLFLPYVRGVCLNVLISDFVHVKKKNNVFFVKKPNGFLFFFTMIFGKKNEIQHVKRK